MPKNDERHDAERAGPGGDVTRLLKDLSRGTNDSVDRLFPLVYEDLRRMAAGFMRRERSPNTLQTTALVHEAYLRLVDQREANWQDKAHFLRIAAQAMRRILVDHARARLRQKRGGSVEHVPFDEQLISMSTRQSEMLVSLDQALARLHNVSQRQGDVIELLFFGGLSQAEAAKILDVSTKTVNRDWRLARAWLNREIAGSI